MAVWELDSTLKHPIDFRIAASGFVNKVWSASRNIDTTDELARLGYRVVRLDGAEWHSPADFHDSVSTALSFPAYYGRNLDALNDCLGDVAERAYGWRESDVGLALAVDNFESYFALDPRTATHFANNCVRAGQTGALFGNRILTLLKVADAAFAIPAGDNFTIPWIATEFLDSSRR